ncbi:hypothetical protein [Cryptosporangium aurantiacum]|uniref:Uncharacterized protein n=1 Tax=Cryptosporangium aurantiacum TaxID=134849 RepID=A0A1M7RDS5_9ACTN|nr:hypothetical protein [Cryptosporangium aurantiacum]SHN44331.1 hypothetical protein SAMN05443668_110165 [Cryptosporangium aurantiacum]
MFPANDHPLLPGDHNLWARHPGEQVWRVQINLEPITAGTWAYRRDPRVTRPVAEASWRSGRVTCINPAVQLPWKARSPRDRDEQDYRLVHPRLPAAERRWLRDAVRLAHPESPWAAGD